MKKNDWFMNRSGEMIPSSVSNKFRQLYQRRPRIFFAVLFLLLLLIETVIALLLRGGFIRSYLGDMLVILLLYFGIKAIRPAPAKGLPVYLLLIGCLAEGLQYLRLVDLLNLSGSPLARTLIGTTFSVRDILMYFLGACCAAILEWRVFAPAGRNRPAAETETEPEPPDTRRGRPFVIAAGKRALLVLLLLALLGTVLCILIHRKVTASYAERIFSEERFLSSDADSGLLPEDFSADCILILGAGVTDGTPSPMLTERLNTGLALYEAGAAPKIVVSGDHGRTEYDEVNVMKAYLTERGVPSEDIFMDHAGFSTYESMYRMKEVFCVSSMLVVTQEYHLFRSLYIANELGINAYGVSCDTQVYSGQAYRELREMLARIKDYLYVVSGARPTYLGDPIPVSGSGDITNDLVSE